MDLRGRSPLSLTDLSAEEFMYLVKALMVATLAREP